MALRRKTRKLVQMKEKETTNNQMSFFDPVYQINDPSLNGNESSENETPNRSMQRQISTDTNPNRSDETLEGRRSTNDADDSAAEISVARITERIKQIQSSIEQAQMMLDSMEQFKDLVPGSEEQCEKLRMIINSLSEQQTGYVNLLNLINITNEERMTLLNKMSALQRSTANEEEEDDDDDEEVRASERKSRPRVPSPVRPRIESKIGFTPQAAIPSTPTVNAASSLPSWDIDGNNRHDNSNYDSLVGSLKSDTINWKDQQSTSGDEASDAENEKEMERHLMLQKEQLRALQGQQRALLALKRRSEQRLLEQQQLLKKTANEPKEMSSDQDLLKDINHLRDRLKLLRQLYEEKHQHEVEQMKSPMKKSTLPAENRLKNLDSVRERLSELEEIVNYYQYDLMNQTEEETTVYEETPIQPDDVQRLKALMMQQRQKQHHQPAPPSEATPENLDQLSNELAAKRLELEQAKSALSRLQQMVEKIEPDQRSPPSTRATTTTTNETDLNRKLHVSTGAGPVSSPSVGSKTKPSSLLSSILSPEKSNATSNTYADAKMAAQHREIERLVESRQRLHTIKDQIASLHQSMTTPTVPVKKEEKYVEEEKSYNANRRVEEEEEEESDFDRFECESGDGEEIDDDDEIPSRMKQGNFHAPEDILAEHEERLLNKSQSSSSDLTVQMREICSCLTSFIQEQKNFNRHIEEHISKTSTAPSPMPVDPVFNQFQQQVLTQGLIVNLNSAYREIAILQSEVNALQSENHRLTSSLSSMDRSNIYSREDSKESIYSLDQAKMARARPRSRFEDHGKVSRHHHHRSSNSAAATTNATNKFENSSKTSFTSQSTGQQTAIHVTKPDLETTPIQRDRNGSFKAARLSSPNPTVPPAAPHRRSYDLSSKENLSKSFIIHRRPLTSDTENSRVQSDLFHYQSVPSYDRYAKYQRRTYDDEEEEDDDDDDDVSTSEKEQQTKDLSTTISNIRPSAYYASTNQDLENLDIQTMELQVKSIMVQLIPFMRLHINDVFNQSILNHIRERIIFLFKQQPDSATIVRHFHDQFSESLGKAIEKYSGTTIRDCAGDLIRDISDVAFDELVKYKLLETNDQLRPTASDENLLERTNPTGEPFGTSYETSHPRYIEPISSVDDGDNETKYQIELAESESRPLMLIGSDEEDNDSDQEENKDSELETAVSRQETNVQSNENPVASEFHSNGHEYILVDRSVHRDHLPPVATPDEIRTDEHDNE